jgi:hypothetical protein
MKTLIILKSAALVSGFAATVSLVAGCSSGSLARTTDKDIAVNGPTVVDARTDPSTFELNRELTIKGAEIVAEVQDFDAGIKSVQLHFARVPLDIPMSHVAGNTWHAMLTDKQLKKLAIDGQTMRYEAYVVASDKNGRTSTSPKSVIVAVKAPSLSTSSG